MPEALFYDQHTRDVKNTYITNDLEAGVVFFYDSIFDAHIKDASSNISQLQATCASERMTGYEGGIIIPLKD